MSLDWWCRSIFILIFFSESKCDEMNAMHAEQVNNNHPNPSTVTHNSSSLFFALFPFPSEFSIAISPLAIGHPASHIPFLFENARNLTPFSFFWFALLLIPEPFSFVHDDFFFIISNYFVRAYHMRSEMDFSSIYF